MCVCEYVSVCIDVKKSVCAGNEWRTQAAFEAEHGIDRASLRNSQEAAMAARLAQLEEEAYNIKVHTRRQPGDHSDPTLHLHQTEDGKWERQVTLDSLARQYKNALPRTMATQQNLVEDLHILKKSIGHDQARCVRPVLCVVLCWWWWHAVHSLAGNAVGARTQGEAAKEQWLRDSIGYHSAKHLNENPIPKVRRSHCSVFCQLGVGVEMAPSAHPP